MALPAARARAADKPVAPSSPAASKVSPAKGTAASGWKKVTAVEGITEYALPNGLRVLLYPDASKPTVTVNITYFVGSRHEGYGETGMAHLLEHMLFKGTPRRPDIWKLLQDRGADFNGTTWYDRTNYYETLPATGDNLEFALALEADRMMNSKIAAEDLAKEFSVVRNEFEMGENDPASILEQRVYATAYEWHNYGKSTIGSRSDIERVPIENLRAFYKKHYQPDNALLIVAGKFDEAAALASIEEHFAGIPASGRPKPTWTEEPVQDGERQVTLRRTGDVAIVSAAYHGVAGADPAWVAQDALMFVLTDQPSGRLYKGLVEKGLASEVFGSIHPTAEPGLLYMGAKVRKGGSPEKVRAELVRVVDAVAAGGKDGVRAEEIERWRTKSLKEFELALTETGHVGVALSDFAAMGDWRLFFLTRERVRAVKVADVARVAKDYLKESNRTIGLFLPDPKPDRAPLPARPDVAAMMTGFKGAAAGQEGEVFEASIENIEQRTTRDRLPGGLQLAFLPKRTKGAAVRVFLIVRYGSEKELRGKTAAAEMIPSMLMRGTTKRSFQQLKDELDRLKAEVRLGGGGMISLPGVAQVRVKTVRETLPQVLALLGEMLRSPAFAPAEFEIARKETLSRLEESLQDPMANGFVALTQRIFPWPAGDVRYIETPRESIDLVKKVKVQEAAALHKKFWGAQAAQLVVVGDFDPAEVRKIVEAELGSWKASAPFERITMPFRAGKTGDATLKTPDKKMAFVGVGHPLELRDDDPDFAALRLVNHILGGSASSRLLDRLRQKEGLSYGAFSGVDARAQDRSGFFFAGAICAPENADKAARAMMEELERLLKDGFPDKELADAKKSYAEGWKTDLANDDFVAGELGKGLYLGRTLAFWQAVNDRIQKLSPADLLAAARKHIQPEKLARVRAGDL